ncbi:MAG: TolC family protein [Deltaproteobacteria bacterium]|nr:TolC family protein [Deltaproteobacteria bacterium]
MPLKTTPTSGPAFGIVDAARAGVDEATGQRWPSLNALGRYAHYLDPQRLVPARKFYEAGAYSEDILGGDLVMRMPLYTGGRITNEIRASEAVQLSTEERLVRARQELVFDVSRVFFFMLGQRHVIESVAFSKKTLEQHRERIVALMEAKRAARVDRLRLDVRLSSVKQTLVQEKNILDIQQRLLANLLGIKTEAGVDVKGALELPLADTDLNQSLEKAHRYRSDYKAVLAEVEAQTRRVDVARAGNRPSVFLEGVYGGRWAVGSVEKGLDDSASEQVGQAGIVVNIPIFEGVGSRHASVRNRQGFEPPRRISERWRFRSGSMWKRPFSIFNPTWSGSAPWKRLFWKGKNLCKSRPRSMMWEGPPSRMSWTPNPPSWRPRPSIIKPWQGITPRLRSYTWR